jgi:YHS domain-containing protein
VTKYIAFTLVLVGACTSREENTSAKNLDSVAAPTHAEPAAQPRRDATFTHIADASTVCMVNDRYMGSAQIPVVVDGKTYYGCCKMCEKRLHEEPAVRSATDPVSHELVDKALAILAQDRTGNVFYFSNESSLKRANESR